MKPVADGPVQQHGRHAGVHATTQTEDNPVVAQLLLSSATVVSTKWAGVQSAEHPHLVDEVAEQGQALLAVVHLGVELMPQVGSSSKTKPAYFTSSVLQVMRVRWPALWMVSPWLIQTALPSVMPENRRSLVSMWVKWARPYSRLSLASTLPPPFWASHWAPKQTPRTGHLARTPSRSGAGALASRTLWGLPERMTLSNSGLGDRLLAPSPEGCANRRSTA